MTGITRRRLLAASSVAAAGCLGYRPGAGDPRWSTPLRAYRSVGSSYLLENDGGVIACLDAQIPTRYGMPVTAVLLAAIDPDGTVDWQTPVEGELASRPAIADAHLFVPLVGGEIAVVDRRDGDTERRVSLGAEIRDTGTVPDGIVVADVENRLVELGSGGTERWSASLEGVSAVAATKDRTVACASGEVILVGRQTGRSQERLSLSTDRGRELAHAIASDDFVSVATLGTDATLAGIDVAAGTVEWTAPVSDCRTRPSIGAELVAVGGSRSVSAFDRLTGDPAYTASDVDVPPTTAREAVYTGDRRTCEAVALAPDGTEAWRSPLEGECASELPAPQPLPDAVVYRSDDAYVSAFRRESGQRPSVL